MVLLIKLSIYLSYSSSRVPFAMKLTSWFVLISFLQPSFLNYDKKGLVSKETVVLRRWGSDTRKFGLSTELIM